MKVINGKDATLGRLASYVAKEALKGEEIVVINCDKIVISGNKKDIQQKFESRRKRVGSGQKGPKYSLLAERIVKRAIRGMIPNHRKGRGKIAYQKIKCYVGIPEEFKEVKSIQSKGEKKLKYSYIGDFSK